jgi:hypothetical protein
MLLILDISTPCWPQDITRRLNYITVYEPFNTSLDPAYEPQARFSNQQWKDDSPVFSAFRLGVYHRFIVYCHQPTCHPMATDLLNLLSIFSIHISMFDNGVAMLLPECSVAVSATSKVQLVTRSSSLGQLFWPC